MVSLVGSIKSLVERCKVLPGPRRLKKKADVFGEAAIKGTGGGGSRLHLLTRNIGTGHPASAETCSLCCSFRNPVGAHGGERKTACEGAFIFISLTVGSVSWWYVEVVPVS